MPGVAHCLSILSRFQTWVVQVDISSFLWARCYGKSFGHLSSSYEKTGSERSHLLLKFTSWVIMQRPESNTGLSDPKAGLLKALLSCPFHGNPESHTTFWGSRKDQGWCQPGTVCRHQAVLPPQPGVSSELGSGRELASGDDGGVALEGVWATKFKVSLFSRGHWVRLWDTLRRAQKQGCLSCFGE